MVGLSYTLDTYEDTSRYLNMPEHRLERPVLGIDV